MNEIFKKFSPNLKKALIDAEKLARERNSNIDTEHQLLALLYNKNTLAYEILTSFDISADRIELIATLIGRKEPTSNSTVVTNDAKKTIQLAVQSAAKFNHGTIGSEHLLLALMSTKTFNSYGIIERIGVDPKKIKKQIDSIFKGINNSFSDNNAGQNQNGFAIMPENALFPADDNNDDASGMFQGPMPFMQTGTANTGKESTLDSFGTNLTKYAAEERLDPVIGREEEIERIIQILSRRTKNNPILIGEPGVGKTSIIEGLAQRITKHEVPEKIQNTEIYSLDLGSILAGTMYRGQFEARIKKLLAEIKKRGNVILFVDEIHMMVGAGSTEGSIDAANLLKPMLAKGELRLIGSTTFDEYKKHIEKDAAFERRFQPVKVNEPTISETVNILKGIVPRYEKFHGVTFSENALIAAAELSNRYINDRNLPDKAIDLIDEAGAAASSKKSGKDKLTSLKKELEKILRRKDNYIIAEKYEEATKLREKELKLLLEIDKESKNKKEQWTEITEAEISRLVSLWTGVPTANMSVNEKKNYVNLDDRLNSYIIGQDEAIKELSKAIKRARVGISNPSRPIGSFIFLGPTGVGKTELAKVLAKEVFGRENALIKIDMSEFMEKHNVSRLVGAPAGYVGYDEGGKLTEAIRKNSYSVVLFDEIEKAHPEVFNILLQIMEDGTLTDAKGRRINFANSIIILTSNLGTDVLRRQPYIGFNKAKDSGEDEYQKLKESVTETVEKTFRPEFINRLDQVIVFRPLSIEVIEKIVELQLNQLKERLEKQKIELIWSEPVVNAIAKRSYKVEFGARPIRKYIQDHIETLITDAILEEKFKETDTINLILNGEKFELKKLKVVVPA